MAIFNFNVSQSTFDLTLMSEISTSCSTYFEYEVVADPGDVLEVTLTGTSTVIVTWENQSYKIGSTVFSDWINETTKSITYSSNGLRLIFSIENSGVTGFFNGAELTVVNTTQSSTRSLTGTRYNDSPSCNLMSLVIDEDNMASDSATKVPTQQSVKAYVDANLAVNDAMIFKGTVGVGGTLTGAAFNALVVYNSGWSYKIITAGTYKGVVAEVGDQYMPTVDRASSGVNADWTVIQTNIDGAVTGPASSGNNNVAIFNGTSGKLIKDSGVSISGSNSGDEVQATTTVKGIAEIATQTEVNTGADNTRIVTPLALKSTLGITANLSTTLTYSQLVGGAISQVITHSIGNQFVQVSVYEVAGMDEVECEVELTSATTTTLKFNIAPASNALRVVIIG